MLDKILDKLTEQEQEHIKKLINIDALTEVYNRRYFNERVEKEVHRAEHSENDVSLLLVDIDDFKKYQDNHIEGHKAGDKLLYQLAQHLKEHTKDYDSVCRYGGEEFSIICPATNIKQGKEIGKRLREYIDIFMPITVSIGVSNYKGNADNVMDLVYKADRGLYQAKNKGKNRVEIWDEIVKDVD